MLSIPADTGCVKIAQQMALVVKITVRIREKVIILFLNFYHSPTFLNALFKINHYRFIGQNFLGSIGPLNYYHRIFFAQIFFQTDFLKFSGRLEPVSVNVD